MPLYDYRCRQCGTVTEVRHGFNEEYREPCSACQGEMARVFNAAGIVFKGSGFYITDSRKGGSGESAGGSGASTAGTPNAATPAPAAGGDGAAAPAAPATPAAPAAPAGGSSVAAA